MNSIFNINRFLKYGKRYVITHLNQYIYALLIVGGFTLLALLLYILIPMISPGTTTPLLYGVLPLCFVVITLAPCFFEKPIKKNNSIFDFILPVSNFEKFVTRLLNFIFILPVILIGTIYILSQTAALLSENNTEAIQNAFDLSKILSFKGLYIAFIVQSLYWIGYYYFRRHTLIKSTITMIGSLLITIVLSMLITFIVFRNFEFSETMNINIIAQDIQYATAIPKYILSFLFPLGPWLVCMLKIRETEI